MILILNVLNILEFFILLLIKFFLNQILKYNYLNIYLNIFYLIKIIN